MQKTSAGSLNPHAVRLAGSPAGHFVFVGQHLNISVQKVDREREAREKDQEEMFQALEDDKAKVGPGKSRHVSRSGAVIRVDVERASKL